MYILYVTTYAVTNNIRHSEKDVIHWYTTPCISLLYTCYTWGQYMPDIHTCRTLFSTSDVIHSHVKCP